MNEQDLILKQKIEKREKIDTIIAYVLLVILSAAIIFVLYLKFIRKEEVTKPEEYIPTYISLNEISTSLNNSKLASEYSDESSKFTSTVSGNILVVNYIDEDSNVNINIPQVESELEIILSDENDLINDIYKELATIICKYYGNNELSCRNITDYLTFDSQIDGIRNVNDENNRYIYISTLKSIDINSKIIYNNITKTNINNTNYTLNLEGLNINDINITKEAGDLKFNGVIDGAKNEESNVSVVVKLYDLNDIVITENKYIFDENNPLSEKNNFEIAFTFNEEDINNIALYSIEVIK